MKSFFKLTESEQDIVFSDLTKKLFERLQQADGKGILEVSEEKKKYLPTKLYRYQKVNKYNLVNLINSQVFFSRPKKFNDPFDCNLAINMEHFTEWLINDNSNYKWYQDILKNNKGFLNYRFSESMRTTEKFIGEFQQKFFDLVNEVFSITCFSETKDNILMWSHYAENHTGFCVEYQIKNPVLIGFCFPALYSKERKLIPIEAVISLMSKSVDNKVDPLSVLPIYQRMFYKSKEWKYENEWRIISYCDDDTFEQAQNIEISKVYVGANCSKEDEHVIIKICEIFKQPGLIEKMKIKKDKYEFDKGEILRF